MSDNGICGVTPAGGVTAPVSLDLSVGGTSTNNTTFENWAAPNGFDMASNTLLFVPSNPGFSYTLLGAPANCSDAQTYGLGCDGLTLASVGLPTLGNANYTLRAATVPAASPLAFARTSASWEIMLASRPAAGARAGGCGHSVSSFDEG